MRSVGQSRIRSVAIALLGVLFALVGPPCSPSLRAEETPPHEQTEEMSPRERAEALAHQRTAEMSERLQLTEQQEEQIRPIVLDGARKMHAVREEYAGRERSRATIGALRDELQKLREETRTKLERILTEEQMTEYDKLREEWRDRNRRLMRERRGRP